MIVSLHLWGRDISLKVVYDCYAGEKILPSQREAAEEFVKYSAYTDRSIPQIIHYMNETYFVGRNIPEDSDLYRYLQPECLYAARLENRHRIAVLCSSPLEEEHGIAVVYDNGVFKAFGQQDIIL